MDERFLTMLRCPITGDRLQMADQGLLDKAERAVRAGSLRDRLGLAVEDFEGGLTDTQRRWLYPIRHDIPNMIPDQAIEIAQLASADEDTQDTRDTPQHEGPGASRNAAQHDSTEDPDA